jgi:predicted dehydrogenase
MNTPTVLNIGLIGWGYWGPKLARNLAALPGVQIRAICDHNAANLRHASGEYPGVRVTQDDADLIDDPAVDAVVIATPAASHFDLARRALMAGKPVLVEKPLAISSEQAAQLIDTAARHRQVLMVDHTYAYADPVRQIKTLIETGQMGRLHYYDSTRANLGTFRPDVNVLWDLAVHDLAILDVLLGTMPFTVLATGAAHIPGQRENTAYLTCRYDDSLIAHIHANWLSPVRIRRVLIAGSLRGLCYDEAQVTVYDTGAVFAAHPVEEVVPPVDCHVETLPLSRTETLRAVGAHFLDCVTHHKNPLTDGAAGLRVVQILEAADRSLAGGGLPVPVEKI